MKNLSKKLKIAILPTILTCVVLTACGNTKLNTDNKNNTKLDTTIQPLDKSATEALKANLTANLKKSGFETEITNIRATKMPELYWVTTKDLPAFFTDKTGTFVIQGDIIKMGGATPEDISSSIKQESAKELLAKVDEKDMVIFKAKGETKGIIYAFTDVDCGYCRKLHDNVKDINAEGVEVRYLAWPRSKNTYPTMQNIWCADDTNVAMNTAKSGGKLPTKTCENPIDKQVEIGHQLGVTGTPAIFTESGAQIGGYLPTAQLVKAAIK